MSFDTSDLNLIPSTAGDDTILGGDSNDLLGAGVGNDQIDGGAGRDTIDFSSAATGVNVDLSVGNAFSNGATPVFATQGSDTAEIVVFDSASQQFFVAGGEFIDVIDANGNLVASIQVSTEVTSVAVSNGLVAAAVPADPESDPGQVLIFEIDGLTSSSIPVQTITVGALPDSLAFTPDGSTIIVANEGEADIIEDEENETFSVGAGGDPEGSISVIDVVTGNVTTLGFTAFNDQQEVLEGLGAVFFGQPGIDGTTVAQDLEPEFVAISSDGNTAFVTLQENNAIAIVDLSGAEPVLQEIVGLGSLDLSTVAIDANDNDGVPNQVLIPGAISLLQPDAITSFDIGGLTFFATANEGDGRDFDVSDLDDTTLDPTAFPNAAALQDNDTGIGDFEVSPILGDTDGDGDIDQIIGFGGRSFSILDANGDQVFNSGNLLTSLLIERFPLLFNDARSDDAGPEPESVTVVELDGQTFLFVGLERSGAVLAFEIDLVAGTGTGGTAAEFDVEFAGLVTVPIPGGFPLTEDLDDLVAPEGLLVIPASQSPTGEALIVISDEEQGVTFGFNLDLGATSSTSISNVENVVGSGFDDAIAGDAGANVVDGGAGNDNLFGGGGADTLLGGVGDDTLRGAGGSDVIDGGAGNDTNSFVDIGVGVTANIDRGVAFYQASNGFVSERFTNIENLTGTNSNDSLSGDDRANILSGGDGDDTLRGLGRDDEINGGEGADVIFSGSGNDSISGGDGNDRLFTVNGNDIVNAGDGDDLVIAGAGDDVINGGAGDDVLAGGNGADTFVFEDDAGSNRVIDFGAGDTIDITAFGFADFSALLEVTEQVEGAVVIALDDDTSLTLENTGLGSLSVSDFLL